jgi:hypothetical protein
MPPGKFGPLGPWLERIGGVGGSRSMNEKKPFIVSHWDDFFLTNKIRSLERKKKTNLYLATMGCLCFALFGAVFARGAYAETNPVSVLQAQRAVWLAIVFGIVLLVATVTAAVVWRTSEKVALLESSLIKGFGSALDSSDLNPNKKDNKKTEVRT